LRGVGGAGGKGKERVRKKNGSGYVGRRMEGVKEREKAN
jgi:hypothetical protein